MIHDARKAARALRKSRRAVGLTRASLARLSGVSRAIIARLESGSWKPPAALFMQVVQTCDSLRLAAPEEPRLTGEPLEREFSRIMALSPEERLRECARPRRA